MTVSKATHTPMPPEPHPNKKAHAERRALIQERAELYALVYRLLKERSTGRAASAQLAQDIADLEGLQEEEEEEEEGKATRGEASAPLGQPGQLHLSGPETKPAHAHGCDGQRERRGSQAASGQACDEDDREDHELEHQELGLVCVGRFDRCVFPVGEQRDRVHALHGTAAGVRGVARLQVQNFAHLQLRGRGQMMGTHLDLDGGPDVGHGRSFLSPDCPASPAPNAPMDVLGDGDVSRRHDRPSSTISLGAIPVKGNGEKILGGLLLADVLRERFVDEVADGDGARKVGVHPIDVDQVDAQAHRLSGRFPLLLGSALGLGRLARLPARHGSIVSRTLVAAVVVLLLIPSAAHAATFASGIVLPGLLWGAAAWGLIGVFGLALHRMRVRIVSRTRHLSQHRKSCARRVRSPRGRVAALPVLAIALPAHAAAGPVSYQHFLLSVVACVVAGFCLGLAVALVRARLAARSRIAALAARPDPVPEVNGLIAERRQRKPVDVSREVHALSVTAPEIALPKNDFDDHHRLMTASEVPGLDDAVMDPHCTPVASPSARLLAEARS